MLFTVPTTRDYFAAAALTGLLAWSPENTRQYTAEEAADEAFAFADAMLARRKVDQPAAPAEIAPPAPAGEDAFARR